MTRTSGWSSRRPECRGCGAGLDGEPAVAQRRHQVTDIAPAPAPRVTEYVAQAKECPCCGTVTEGELPAHVRARASYGPEASRAGREPDRRALHPGSPGDAAAVPARRPARSPTGWMAGIRGKAAALVEASGFMERVRELLRAAAAVHADETPARAAGGMRYVHLACTAYLTHMHTGDRSARRHRRRRRPARLRRDHRPRRLLRLPPPHRCAACLVRGAPAQGPEGPVRLRARKAGLGLADGLPAHRGPRRREGRPRRTGRPPWTPPSWAGPDYALPHARRVRAGREPLPGHRDRGGRLPDRPPVPEVRGHDPPLRRPS